MTQKSQRIRVTEQGWKNYTGYLGGVDFKDGVSVELVDPMTASRLGSILAIKLVDTDQQAGHAADLVRTHEARAEVVAELPRVSTAPKAPAAPAQPATPTYTREALEAVADKNGIAGLRAIAEKIGVRGRGIGELIEAILKGQA